MKDNGGSAFPVAHQIVDANHEHFKLGCKGMTLRDYFAAKAIQGKSVGFQEIHLGYYEAVAKSAYSLADAMLNERNKP
jgi:hypothetical protein